MNCPICNKPPLPENQQPQLGTHAYTTIYECGTEIDRAFGSEEDEWDYSQKCNEPHKLNGSELIDAMMEKKKKKDFSALTFKIQSFPQTHIAMMHEYTGYMLKAMEESETYNDRGYNTITAPELMVAVMKSCRGSANPMVVQELIKQLHKDS